MASHGNSVYSLYMCSGMMHNPQRSAKKRLQILAVNCMREEKPDDLQTLHSNSEWLKNR